MKVLLISVVTLFISVICSGKLILPGEYDVLNLAMSANPYFIDGNGIKSISVKIQIKRDGLPLQLSPEQYLTQFNNDGSPHMHYRITELFGKPDTAWTSFSGQGRFSSQITCRGTSARSIGYQKIDESTWAESIEQCPCAGPGRVVKTECRKQQERLISLNQREPLIEAYTTKTPTGQIFKTDNYEYDDLGFLIGHREFFHVTRQNIDTEFDYDLEGRLHEVRVSNEITKSQTQFHFEYDALGNLFSYDEVKNDKHIRSGEFVLDDTGLPEGVVEQDHKEGTIRMLKFAYTFYD